MNRPPQFKPVEKAQYCTGYEGGHRIAKQYIVSIKFNPQPGQVEEDGARHQTQTKHRSISCRPRIKDQSRCDQLQDSDPDPSPGLHAQYGEQMYRLRMRCKLEIKGLQHDQRCQQPEYPQYQSRFIHVGWVLRSCPEALPPL